jgi:hypothetical protein
MRILLSVPPAPFREVEVGSALGALQKAVGGSVEFVWLGSEEVELVINETSLADGLMPNREANRLFRGVIGYGNLLCGPVAIVGSDGERTVSVPGNVIDAVVKGVWPPADPTL